LAIKRVTVVGLAAAVLWLTVATILAHEVTYDGTVEAIKLNRYAASSGIIATLEVKVSDRKRPMVFDITQRTRLLRGDSTVPFAHALIRKDERVVVRINHDDPDEGAIEIRLAVLK
jgi:hypothetical protein